MEENDNRLNDIKEPVSEFQEINVTMKAASAQQGIVVPQDEDYDKYASMKKVAIVAVAGIIILALLYMMFFPLPILESVNAKNNAATTIDELDMSLVSDENAMAEAHAELVQKTQTYYTSRRNELDNEIRNGVVNDAAVARAKQFIADGRYGESAVFGGLVWDIPESEEQKDLTITQAEADKILYIYSCLYDQDFAVNDSDFFDKWFYGDDSMNSTYPIYAYGTVFEIPCRGGYYLPPELLQPALQACRREANEAVKKDLLEKMKQSSPLMRVLVPLCSPFVTLADADDVSNPIYQETLRKTYENVARNYGGKAAVDQILYAGVSDQVTGKISFTMSGTPSYKSGFVRIEDWEDDSATQEAIKPGVLNPFMGRVAITISESESFDFVESSCNPLHPMFAPYDAGDYERYADRHIFDVQAKFYPCEEMVLFTAVANINASGTADLAAEIGNRSYLEQGNTDWTKYAQSEIARDEWCAKYTGYMFKIFGQELSDEAGCQYWEDMLQGDLPRSDGTKKAWNEHSGTNLTIFGRSGPDAYTPKVGDIIMFHDSDGKAVHIAYVCAIDEFTITYAEGNAGGISRTTPVWTGEDGGESVFKHASFFENPDMPNPNNPYNGEVGHIVTALIDDEGEPLFIPKDEEEVSEI